MAAKTARVCVSRCGCGFDSDFVPGVTPISLLKSHLDP